MQDFEKLGAFYLGKRFDLERDALSEDLVLYDASDLTTHAAIIGMTGSGKTGLGIALIEEAAIDRIPVIAIDPKGDLGNLLLSFPDLAPADFEPWIDQRQAGATGQSAAEFASSQATLWRRGLAEWGQGPERIRRLRDSAEFAIYTPGSSTGRSISIMTALEPPPETLARDSDLYRQHVDGAVSGLLTLVGIEADPLASRDHILLATILDAAWREQRTLELAGLIAAVQRPGLDRVGVLDLETFYPARERFALALRLNNLLASPGFKAWSEGEPLDADTLLFGPSGKPRVSVLSIAHLSDAERMFFVTMLLNELVAWMRTQPGSSSLRALVYMDEVFGYLPPVAAPPSKPLLLTLLKQARAFGLGLVLATQNPVDLDYKALSNMGTWLIGRLQTDRDRARVRDGLLGAGTALDAAELDRVLSGLGKRCFLLHNVHERAPVILQTRWVLSYLRGPLTREDIRRLSPAPEPEQPPPALAHVPRPVPAEATRPVLPPGLPAAYVPVTQRPQTGERLVYYPRLLAAARVAYVNARLGVDERREWLLAAEVENGAANWTTADEIELGATTLDREPEPDAAFAAPPAALLQPARLRTWQTQLATSLRNDRPLVLLRSPTLKLTSRPDEDERAFRIRLQQLGREAREREVAKLRQRYAARAAKLQERLRRAEQAVAREAEQAQTSKLDTAMSVGTALLGALLGRKAVSATTASRVGTAVRRAGYARRQAGDVARAEASAEALRQELQELEERLAEDIAGIEDAYDAQAEALDELPVRPRASDVSITFLGLGWIPYIEDTEGRITPA